MSNIEDYENTYKLYENLIERARQDLFKYKEEFKIKYRKFMKAKKEQNPKIIEYKNELLLAEENYKNSQYIYIKL